MPSPFDPGGTLDQEYINGLFKIESNNNPNAKTGSQRGLGQFGPTEEQAYGINAANRTNPAVQRSAVQQEAEKNHARLTKALGYEAGKREHYVAHQQGLEGAAALYNNPDIPAWQAVRPFYKSDEMAKKAITGNILSDSPLSRIPVDNIPSSAFTNMWHARFDRTQPTDISPEAQASATGSPAGLPEQAGTPTPPAPRAISELSSTPSAPPSAASLGLGPRMPDFTPMSGINVPQVGMTETGAPSVTMDLGRGFSVTGSRGLGSLQPADWSARLLYKYGR